MLVAPFRVNADIPSQKVAYGAASGVTQTAFGSQTYTVRVAASSDCFIKFGGANAIATQNDCFVRASQSPEYFVVTPGQFIAAVRDVADGTLFVTEMCR